MKNIIYLDNSATTPVNKRVAKKVQESFLKDYGNASSQHKLGEKAKQELENSRKEIAKFINSKSKNIIFTSGGTESNNLAIKGLASANPHRNHIITSTIEHPSILETCKLLEKQGYKVDYIPVDNEGMIRIKELKNKITKRTLLVSIMHVNNEIGSIQPISEIGKICRENKVYFHSDCVQSFGKIDIDVEKMNLDLISVSGHKINAPKGVGFLYVRNLDKISPIINGGGQENNLRSGTENISGIIGLSEALKIKRNKKQIQTIRDNMVKELLKIPGTRLNGPPISKNGRIYHNINISFYGIEGESLVLLLDKQEICSSTGSACSSYKLKESHVLKAIGVDNLHIHGSLRLSLDEITEKQADFVIKEIKKAVEKLRKISPFKLN